MNSLRQISVQALLTGPLEKKYIQLIQNKKEKLHKINAKKINNNIYFK